MKALLATLVALSTFAFFTPFQAYATTYTLKDSYHPTLPTNDNFNPINTTEYWSQVFTPSSSYSAGAVTFSMRFALSCTTGDTMTVSLRATSAGVPVLPDLATGTFSLAGMSGSFGFATTTFGTPLAVTSGTQYAIVMKATCNEIIGQADEANGPGYPYAGGKMYSNTASGADGSWTAFVDPQQDYAWFEVYSVPAAAAVSSFGILNFFGWF